MSKTSNPFKPVFETAIVRYDGNLADLWNPVMLKYLESTEQLIIRDVDEDITQMSISRKFAMRTAIKRNADAVLVLGLFADGYRVLSVDACDYDEEVN